jgi:hypothetical protein
MSTISSQTSSSTSTSSCTALDPALALVLRASAQQSELGWDQLLRGHLSALWGDAVVHTLLAQHQRMDKHIWATKALKAFLILMEAPMRFGTWSYTRGKQKPNSPVSYT